MKLIYENICRWIYFDYSIWVIKCHHFNMEQYIPYSLICDLFSRNLETYLQHCLWGKNKKIGIKEVLIWYLWMSSRSLLFSRRDFADFLDTCWIVFSWYVFFGLKWTVWKKRKKFYIHLHMKLNLVI